MDDKEVRRLAAAVMARHPSDALEVVERRAQAALDAGKVDVHAVWLSVKEAVLELLRPANDNVS